MLNICGVTFDHTTNYGSCLQALALKTAMEGMQIGDGGVSYDLLPLRRSSVFTTKPQGLNQKLRFALYQYNYLSFSPFEKKYFQYAQAYDAARFGELNTKYDAFVCGSDVIWSPQFGRSIDAYSLGFAEKYAFSYAASIGNAEVDIAELKPIAGNLARLREIGVREASAAKLVSELTGRTAEVVCDPVFLLPRETWESFAAPPKKKKHPYIFVYATKITSPMIELINNLQRETGFGIVYAVWPPYTQYAFRVLRVQPPDRWLQQLRDAEYVVTNSFHATAFSLLFHKNYVLPVEGDPRKGKNVRMYELLSEVGMADRLLAVAPKKPVLDAPDFTRSDAYIETIRADSLAFLRRNLEAAYQEKQRAGQAHIKED